MSNESYQVKCAWCEEEVNRKVFCSTAHRVNYFRNALKKRIVTSKPQDTKRYKKCSSCTRLNIAYCAHEN